jgi:hypothetical protein
MTSNPGMNMNSVLPLNARTTRIAAGGGSAAYAHESPANGADEAFRIRPASPFEQKPNTTIHHN